ncbi:GDP-d-mannose 4,6-dehydratase [Heterosigma akashiwo virus 01]|uniref:GDP-mannose 4,6-dehydratase n=1 Tax=Heterosigma akashiwo virus 01 TaxID=97195 RepID=A0A1C9C5B8_HAV01|nr:nucleotide-sugar epimerase [Heterosigma akashiwo virus 01]AOM63478.1 GDP-d-mannose 4,6-dehydratase [Heterosigma akashiwo virus 01]
MNVVKNKSNQNTTHVKHVMTLMPESCHGRKALITGITGQDGYYLSEFLIKKGYEVHGMIRRHSKKIEHIYSHNKLKLHFGDLSDTSSLTSIIFDVKPDEIYNLGAVSSVHMSYDMPEYTANINGMGILRILDAIRSVGLSNVTKVYQASSSELFGNTNEIPQKETTPFYPRSPYAVSKLFAFWTIVNYREAYGMHLTNGILFNHESPRRSPAFVSRKITRAVARISKGLQDKVILGNLDSRRDWGDARDYVRGIWMMMQLDHGDDFILATGETHTVREFVEAAFAYVSITIIWENNGINEKGRNSENNNIVIEVSEQFFRPIEAETIVGDSSKAKMYFGWEPTVRFNELVSDMMAADIAKLEAGHLID